MTHWWRAYDEAVDDPKLQLLPPALFKVWFNLLCLSSGNGGSLPHVETIAFKLRTSEAKIGAALEELVTRGLLDDFEGTLRPHNWGERQFMSDSNAALRQKRYRDRHRNVTRNATSDSARVQITDTERKEEKKEDAALRADVPRRGRKPSSKVSLPEDWAPSEEIELEFGQSLVRAEVPKMRDWAKSNAVVKADWNATLRNWLRRAGEQRRNGGISNGSPRPGSREDRQERTANAVRQLSEYIEGGADDARASGDARQTDVGLLRLVKPA